MYFTQCKRPDGIAEHDRVLKYVSKLNNYVSRLMWHSMALGKIFSSKVGELPKQVTNALHGTGTCLRHLLDIAWAATMLEPF
jgi:hypothetical protein